MRRSDLADKEVAKQKRREKKEKRKQREREENEAEPGEDVRVDDQDQDALANFIADAESIDGSSGHDRDEVPVPESKRQKKWFQRDEDTKPQLAPEREINTIDELEAEAARLLA